MALADTRAVVLLFGYNGCGILNALSHAEDPTTTKVLHGKVRGRTTELTEAPGLVAGQAFEAFVRIVPQLTPHQAGAGLLLSEGALADNSFFDAIMEKIYQERKNDPRGEILK